MSHAMYIPAELVKKSLLCFCMEDKKGIRTCRLDGASMFVSLSFAFLLVIYFSFLFVSTSIQFSHIHCGSPLILMAGWN